MSKNHLLGLDYERMSRLFVDLGESPWRAKQMLQWVHQHQVLDVDAMTVFSQSLREKIKAHTECFLPDILVDALSKDGTRKWLLRFDDGNSIEMVFIPENGRGTLCISSQVGCALDCTFCATGKQGFNRNLKAWEIVVQVWLAKQALQLDKRSDNITNIVFMGMGEPLLNTQQVGIAARLLLDDNAYGLSKRRVTVSTAGVVPMIERLQQEADISLAVSLHAPSDDLRDAIVPINKKYPIAVLLDACRSFVQQGAQRKHILFEYVMLAGVNDQPHHARALAKLLKGMSCKVNLIPFNPFPNTEYVCSTVPVQLAFQNILQQQGVRTFLRRTRGEDIAAACGQLAGDVQDRTRRTIQWGRQQTRTDMQHTVAQVEQ